ncbi:MAG: hypothetical protein PHG48_01395 [Eubacteriales bacterium]|nr:hypothetical protein [Eubacteriales bacterium]
MSRFNKNGIILISILTIGILLSFFSYQSKSHKSIKLIDIESINIWGNTTRIASSDEVRDIVNWFNSITDIRANKDFEGTTPEAGIVIKLKTGDSILILKSGIDFEVQRTNIFGKRISYWGKEANIRRLLEFH